MATNDQSAIARSLSALNGAGTPARAPSGLAKSGRDLWKATAAASWLAPTDLPALADVARLADVRAQLEKAISDRGVVLEEPIVSPTGKVVGTRVVTNPAVPELCRVDRRMSEGLAALGFTAKSRADLGIIVAEAERLQLAIDDFLATKYQKGAYE
jgi:Phage terminase, small subunit